MDLNRICEKEFMLNHNNDKYLMSYRGYEELKNGKVRVTYIIHNFREPGVNFFDTFDFLPYRPLPRKEKFYK